MSDDLISRKALLEEIRSQNILPVLKMNLKPEHKKVMEIEELIIRQPTAYDLISVEEQIRKHSYFMGIRESMVETIVSIVKKGGKNG